jgi:hypothetical protein
MFNQQRLIGSTRKDIRLDTRRGIGIKNQIEPQPTQQTLAREQISIQQFGSNWEQRAGPRGVYNCAGLVWASRRTAIVDDEEWNKIYDHDNYRELNTDETPKPGDLAVYLDGDVGYIHVGQVISIEAGLANEARPIPKILSKWDSASGEYIHYPPDVPFRMHFPDFQLTYWTDR